MKTYTLLQYRSAVHTGEGAMLRKILQGDIKEAADNFLYEARALVVAYDKEDAFDKLANPNPTEEMKQHVVDFCYRPLMRVGDVLVDNKTGIYWVCADTGWQEYPAFEYDMPQISHRNPNLPRIRL